VNDPATTPWSTDKPTICGTYLVQRTGDWFPDGDENNIAHFIVDVVKEGSCLMALMHGRLIEFSDCKDYIWARVIKAKQQ
jgi:hypothetical protein